MVFVLHPFNQGSYSNYADLLLRQCRGRPVKNDLGFVGAPVHECVVENTPSMANKYVGLCEPLIAGLSMAEPELPPLYTFCFECQIG